jgi:hypothetical protein
VGEALAPREALALAEELEPVLATDRSALYHRAAMNEGRRFQFKVWTEPSAEARRARDQAWGAGLAAGEETPEEATNRLRDFEMRRGNLKAITCDAIGCDEAGHACAAMLGSPSAILHDADEEGWTVPNRAALETMAALPPEATFDDVLGLLPQVAAVEDYTVENFSTRVFVLCRSHHPLKDLPYGGLVEGIEPGYEDAAHDVLD